MLTGKIHSIETMGLLDGPGIRTVIFMQGCPLKCSYCHNPDTQSCFSDKQKNMTVEELVKFIKRYKVYYDRSGGGVTFSGGEAMLQGEFLLEATKALKKEGIHIAVDTCGYGNERYYKEVLENVDLLLLDVKHYRNVEHKQLTSKSLSGFKNFLGYLKNYDGKIWLRHVMMPGVTDNYTSMDRILDLTDSVLPSVEKIEVLPYHKMGVEKYKELGMEYKLLDLEEMNSEVAMKYETYIMEQLGKAKDKNRSRRKRVV